MIDFAGPWEVFQDVNIPGQRIILFVFIPCLSRLHPFIQVVG